MRRIASIAGFIILVAAVFAGIFYFARLRRAEKPPVQETLAPAITIYTDLPQGALALFDDPFFKETGYHLQIREMNGLSAEDKSAAQEPDVYVLSQGVLLQLKAEGRLAPYTSEKTDLVLDDYKDRSGYWTGVWMNPAVFAVNTDFAFSHPAFSYTWDEVVSRQSVRLVMTDFIASDYAADGLFSLIEHFGWAGGFDRLKRAASHIVQYGKYLTTPAHMAAMDKCDIGISGYDEAEKVRQEGLPVKVVYPEDGTYFYLYGAALGKQGMEKGKLFIDWLLSEAAESGVWEKNGYHFIHVNETGLPEDDFKRKPRFWPLQKKYSEQGKKELIDLWVQEVRFGKGTTS